MPMLPEPTKLQKRNKPRPALSAGITAIFCLVAALFQLYLGLSTGGVPPEFVLFSVLALIFAGVWWTARRRK
ncbi:MAG: hypothetical protein IVW55_13185 [Chloroflexi bacterium]|nr:hypothetical protein [Chloroflexota bacterium]